MSEIEDINKLLQDRIIYLDSEIEPEISSRIVTSLYFLNKTSQTEPIEFWINSPGGIIESFFAIYDMMNFIQAPIKTMCIGEASSAAAWLLSAGTPGMRYVMPNSRVMIHQIQSDSFGGSSPEVEVNTKELKAMQTRLNEILAKHTGKPKAKINRDTKFDKYFGAKEAIEYGLADQIVVVNK